jgi:osmotically-inducible protein OsmY
MQPDSEVLGRSSFAGTGSAEKKVMNHGILQPQCSSICTQIVANGYMSISSACGRPTITREDFMLAKIPFQRTESEQMIAAHVKLAMQQSGYPELRGIHCTYSDGIASLLGSVSSYYLKQQAQSITCRVPGVRRVNNQVTVEKIAGS